MTTIYTRNEGKRVDGSREYQIFDIEKREEEVISTYDEVLKVFRKAFLYVDNTFWEKKNMI